MASVITMWHDNISNEDHTHLNTQKKSSIEESFENGCNIHSKVRCQWHIALTLPASQLRAKCWLPGLSAIHLDSILDHILHFANISQTFRSDSERDALT